MKIEINIRKKHLFFIILVGIFFAFVIAQTVPNPGHGFSQVSGVAPNCVQVSCPELPTGWGAEAVTSRYAARSYTSDNSLNSNQLGSIPASSYCRSDGTNCQVTLSTEGRGAVVGGGRDGFGGIVACSGNWGGANCLSNSILQCPGGSTKRKTGTESVDDGFGGVAVVSWNICVKN